MDMMAHDKPSANPLDATTENVALERALEGLFRLTANRRFGARQTEAVGAAVTRAGYALLRTLADGEVLNLREVADASHMDSAAASRQINQLVDDGLVSRRTATDARAIELALTPLGRDVYARIIAYRLTHLGNALANWTSDERGALQVLVERLASDLGDTEPPSPISAERAPGSART